MDGNQPRSVDGELGTDAAGFSLAADEDPGSGLIPVTDIVLVRGARRLGPYRLKLWFTDGTAGEWDFSELTRDSGPMVEPFKDPVYFDRVFIEFGALTWPNGYDWSPEALHADMAAAGALAFEPLNSHQSRDVTPPDASTLLERDLNQAFAKAVETSPHFACWLLSKTKFSAAPASVVLARGDNPWSKSKTDGVESETDIIVVFERRDDKSCFALHIENKRPGDHFRPGQPERYRMRAAEWVGLKKWCNYTEFAILVVASRQFLEMNSAKASLFDGQLEYEEVEEFVPEFALRQAGH